mmetsp:Transcript_23779/g.57313  ORF Transcript_23779/g.57313 Transcript_23779/m.57313 type:complete len:214 (+) Transcript_23779:668-1309(+)
MITTPSKVCSSRSFLHKSVPRTTGVPGRSMYWSSTTTTRSSPTRLAMLATASGSFGRGAYSSPSMSELLSAATYCKKSSMNMRGMMSSSACTMTKPLGSGGATSLTATAAGAAAVPVATSPVVWSINGWEAEVEDSVRTDGMRSAEGSMRSDVESSEVQVSEVLVSVVKGSGVEDSTRLEVEVSVRYKGRDSIGDALLQLGNSSRSSLEDSTG